MDGASPNDIQTKSMRWIEGGQFTMGSLAYYPEEAPLSRVRLDGFWIDETPVTNAQFAQFVAATGYVTHAEIPPDPKDYPGMPEDMRRAGSLVFRKSPVVIGTADPTAWWEFCFGADWRHPIGPEGDLAALAEHPVVHITWRDAFAYARWAGKDLPTEAEWEYAARGGLEGKEFAWGDELAPGGAMLANYWQGIFPFSNTMDDGWERTSPVRTYPPNGFGLYDMIGNVWEWTRDWWQGNRTESPKCCVIANPRGGKLKGSLDKVAPVSRFGRKVMKGGSHLCAANYCQRYRPAARHPEPVDTSTSHLGFRCVKRGNR